ncbi:MAG: L-arabinose isomerase [Fimbriimonas sp.]
MNTPQIWFVTGSQHLYGPETLRQVQQNSQQIVDGLNQTGKFPAEIILKPTMTDSDAITRLCAEANATESCAGLILWMHTFSPAKMWIRGLSGLRLPVAHFATQFNRDLPYGEIDMDFMNLNQAAHGDREAGHLHTRLGLRRKVVVGHWSVDSTQSELAGWVRIALGWHALQRTKIARFGDNMRYVSVTDGDKVQAEVQFGFSVNGFGVGDLVARIQAVSEGETDRLVGEYLDTYSVVPALLPGNANHESLKDAARQELGIEAFLVEGGFGGFTTTFEDLHGLNQLPGLACQRLMQKGYGFGAEGDWKTAALLRFVKAATAGQSGGSSFMEDYTYHLEPGNELVLGAHMLELCPSIAAEKPKLEIHPLGIGGKSDPVRLVFDAPAGPALNASLIDLGHRFRLIINTVEAVSVPAMPNLPVGRALWKVQPDFKTGVGAWIAAGGAHHTVYSYDVSVDQLVDFATIAGIEAVVIDSETKLRQFQNELRWNNEVY